MATSKYSHPPLLLPLLFLFSLASISEAMSTLKAMAKDQIECTMCTFCDNPCQPLYSPPPPPPFSNDNCPPPPSKPSSGTYYYSPPPPLKQYYGPPTNGGGGSGGYYTPPTNYYRTPPPNPVVQYFPFYYYSPPALPLRSYSIQLKNYPMLSLGISVSLMSLIL